MQGRAMADKFRQNYATVKSRGLGVSPGDSLYTVTVHKRAVRVGGFECAGDLPLRAWYSGGFDDDGDGGGGDHVDDNGRAEDDGFAADLARFEASLSRSKSTIVQLVANSRWDYFVTFTLSADKLREHFKLSRYDLRGVGEKLRNFMANYKKRRGLRDESGRGLFSYVLIPEFHKDGAVHYHGVLLGVDPDDLGWVNGRFNFLPFLTRFGWSQLAPIRDQLKCASYMSKYITKSMFAGAGVWSPMARLAAARLANA